MVGEAIITEGGAILQYISCVIHRDRFNLFSSKSILSLAFCKRSFQGDSFRGPHPRKAFHQTIESTFP